MPTNTQRNSASVREDTDATATDNDRWSWAVILGVVAFATISLWTAVLVSIAVG